MKRFVLWLIKVFRLDIPVEVVKTVEKVVYMPKNGVMYLLRATCLSQAL